MNWINTIAFSNNNNYWRLIFVGILIFIYYGSVNLVIKNIVFLKTIYKILAAAFREDRNDLFLFVSFTGNKNSKNTSILSSFTQRSLAMCQFKVIFKNKNNKIMNFEKKTTTIFIIT